MRLALSCGHEAIGLENRPKPITFCVNHFQLRWVYQECNRLFGIGVLQFWGR